MPAIPNLGPNAVTTNYSIGDRVDIIASKTIVGYVVGMDPATQTTWVNNNGTNQQYPSSALELLFSPGWYRRRDEPFAPPVNNDVLVAYRPDPYAYPDFTVPVTVSDS